MRRGKRRAGARVLARLLALAMAVALGGPALAGDPPRLVGTVNVNTATVEELQLLPGIGEARAKALVETRKRRGGFKRVEELLEVRGIGEASLEQLRPYVRVQGKSTARIE